MPQMLESTQLYEMAANVVVIDHHRKGVGYIDNSVIFYHEPYASSASELVTELVQYAGGEKEDKMTPLEAQALLAGITLDTRNFALHTGVRTFEAAAYLRRMGAQTQEVKKLFCDTLESYTHKAKLVAAAQVYERCAISVSDDVPADMMVVVPQAANDLLSISGVDASFVAVDTGNGINVSARSMGDVNVQVIMEQLGRRAPHHGGGPAAGRLAERDKAAADGYYPRIPRKPARRGPRPKKQGIKKPARRARASAKNALGRLPGGALCVMMSRRGRTRGRAPQRGECVYHENCAETGREVHWQKKTACMKCRTATPATFCSRAGWRCRQAPAP